MFCLLLPNATLLANGEYYLQEFNTVNCGEVKPSFGGMQADFFWTAWSCIPEDFTLNIHRSENLICKRAGKMGYVLKCTQSS
jgi:hypothetical protein